MNPEKISKMMLDAWNDREWETIRDVLHPEYVYVGPDGARVVGVDEGLAAGWISFADSFGAGHVDVKSVYVDGDTVVTEFHASLPHTGEFDGIPPTGSTVEIDFCNVMKLRDGKVVVERDYFDTYGFMDQLGAFAMDPR